ncbi:MAG: ABC transporter ATP-binding protein [Micromonosporaceae bacterium]|nr:ABC transporter ATP-binding protein [Micromonosporaceae bacterium]
MPDDVTGAGTLVEAPARPGVAVRLVELRRSFGPVVALDGLSLEIVPGELVALLGPSGCGKTTALRALAGLQELDSGQVFVDGRDITRVSAHRRGMGMVFQAYSLFPNMTARENVAYGLRLRRVPAAQRRKRAGELLDLVGLASHAGHYPDQLSGGQQQRVALARALAIQPKVLLLDEPLSALDAKVRAQLRDEIRAVQREVGTTTLFVTHDQEEALAMADRVGVMSAGRLQQIASPVELYERPRTAFVAEFVGLTNRLAGTAGGGSVQLLGARVPLLPGSVESGPVTVLVRPESLLVTPAEPDAAERAAGRVLAATFLGALCRVRVRLDDGTVLLAQVSSVDVTQLAPGTPVRVGVRPAPVLAIAGSA